MEGFLKQRSPSVLHFRGGRKAVGKELYPGMGELATWAKPV
jgi:hypothetical protein